MPSRRREATPAADLVVGADWDTFRAWFADVWQQGQHVALIGPTGTGKSTFGAGICQDRRYVLALDAKGEDSTLTRAGFQRITTWPPPDRIRDDIADGKPARLVIGGAVRTDQEWQQLVATIRRALDAAFAEGSWTVLVDELQLTAQHMGLRRPIERNLIAARDKGSSMVTAYQAPSWVPTAASRQATWLVVWPTRDEDVIKSLAAKAGRDREEMRQVLHALPDYHVVVIGTNPRVPMVMTHPAELATPAPARDR